MKRNVRLVAPWAWPLLLCAAASHALAQAPLDPYRPHAAWRTMETDRFVVHYPREAEAWTGRLVARMEAMGGAVSERIGHAPQRRVTVVVADPFNISNGFALSLLDAPITVLWTTPPDPRAGIGDHRDWAELLFVHEYAHLAHLTFEPRNPRERLLSRIQPMPIGPVRNRSPRWVTEGYATYIEGRVTGHGRPHGTARPAFLRVRALEGQLPTYGGMSGGSGYMDMASAYLVGSAFLEWLAERSGDEALNHLWRRLSARERRSFDNAFSGVFGGAPQELYGQFTVELTAAALAVRDSLEAAGGLVEGEAVQLRRWHTGDPAISPDGSLLAVELPERDGPSRIIVLEVAPDEDAETRRERAVQRLLDRDPLDVPAIAWLPPARRTRATLQPVAGRSHRNPRFLPDGEQVLVVRSEPLGDGTLRPDLFLWNHRTGSVRRVTRGAGIRDADPSPDGSTAAAVRCAWGSCDLVRVDLATGRLTVLAAGSPDVVYARPRHSPDGRTLVVSVQQAGRWRVATLPAAGGGAPRYVDPNDGASRYDAAFMPDGNSLVAVSTLGGIPNLELLELATGRVRTLTRTVGAMAAPEPDPQDGYLYFLRMHSRGWDLNRLHPDSVAIGEPLALPEAFWPITRASPVAVPDTFAAGPLPPSRPYGLGTRRLRLVPAGHVGEDASALHLALVSTDPVGRFTAQLQAAVGEPAAWRGGAASAVLRRWPAHLTAEGFAARQHPSGERRPVGPLDVDYFGGTVGVELTRDHSPRRFQLRLGASAGRLDGESFEKEGRHFAFGEVRATGASIRGRNRLQLTMDAHGAGGRTADEDWSRGRARLVLLRSTPRGALELAADYGRTNRDAPPFERMRVGGSAPILFDGALLTQRMPMPGLPEGLLQGDRALALRLTSGVGGFRPYFWAASVDRRHRRWHRVVGFEQRIRSLANHWSGLPAMELVGGVAHSLDKPFERRTRAYLSVGVRP